jgi:hypothetical protein
MWASILGQPTMPLLGRARRSATYRAARRNRWRTQTGNPRLPWAYFRINNKGAKPVAPLVRH